MKHLPTHVKQFRNYFLTTSNFLNPPTSPETPVAAEEVRIIYSNHRSSTPSATQNTQSTDFKTNNAHHPKTAGIYQKAVRTGPGYFTDTQATISS
jgi:hypothetical protein